MSVNGRRHTALRAIVLVVMSVVSVDCGSSSPAPSTPARTTETFTAVAHLGVDGGMAYGSAANYPLMTVRSTGLVEATAQFTPTAQCQFIVCICRTDGNRGTCDLKAGPGAGPTLSTQGALQPASYYLLMAGRSLGQSRCGDSVPAGGLPFSYTVTVAHP